LREWDQKMPRKDEGKTGGGTKGKGWCFEKREGLQASPEGRRNTC